MDEVSRLRGCTGTTAKYEEMTVDFLHFAAWRLGGWELAR